MKMEWYKRSFSKTKIEALYAIDVNETEKPMDECEWKTIILVIDVVFEQQQNWMVEGKKLCVRKRDKEKCVVIEMGRATAR